MSTNKTANVQINSPNKAESKINHVYVATKPANTAPRTAATGTCEPANTDKTANTATAQVNISANTLHVSCKPANIVPPKTTQLNSDSTAANIIPQSANVAANSTHFSQKTANGTGKPAKLPQKSANAASIPNEISHNKSNIARGKSNLSQTNCNLASKAVEASAASKQAGIKSEFVSPNFSTMNVNDLKEFVCKRGITVSNVT